MFCVEGPQQSLHAEWTPDVTNAYSYQRRHALTGVHKQHQQDSVSKKRHTTTKVINAVLSRTSVVGCYECW